jgi:hypothetical protein
MTPATPTGGDTMQYRFAVVILVLVVLIPCISITSGCDSSTSPTKKVNPDLTPRENAEAENAALWLSGELVAPTDLYEELFAGYSRIRAAYSDSIPELDQVMFVPPWMPGELLIKPTEDAIAELRRGEYHDLDSLNAFYGIAEVDTHLVRIGWIQLIFEGRLHPERLADEYEQVPSLLSAVPNGIIANQADNYPWEIDGGVSYLFRYGWGDCPAGCIYNQWWYFKVREGEDEIEYLGTFVSPDDPKPDWWTEARRAYDAKYN